MRIKTGPTRKKRHNKLLERTKGYRMTKNRLIKVAKEAALHADQYSYVGRKRRKRDLRSLWIIRLNSACRENDLTYSKLIYGLKKAKIEIDRKILAELAVNHPQVFKNIAEKATKANCE